MKTKQLVRLIALPFLLAVTTLLTSGAVASEGTATAVAVNAPTNRTVTGLVWVVGKNRGEYLTGPEIEKVLEGNPHISGLFLGRVWRDIEPARGAYDWKSLDGAVEAARHKGRSYKLMFKPGTGTPDWVYASKADGSPGAAVFETVGPNPHRKDTYQKPVRIPIPWDAAYLHEFERFIRAAGARYAGDPLCVAVAVTGANFESGEAADGDFGCRVAGVAEVVGDPQPDRRGRVHLSAADQPRPQQPRDHPGNWPPICFRGWRTRLDKKRMRCSFPAICCGNSQHRCAWRPPVAPIGNVWE